jgi:hypothetical protein
MTVRAGSSSTCWLSISAKLSFIQILLKEGQGLKIRLIDGIAIRLLPTMARRRTYGNMH